MKPRSIEADIRKPGGGAKPARRIPVPRPSPCAGLSMASGFALGVSQGNALESMA
jgi:hypothetical protein